MSAVLDQGKVTTMDSLRRQQQGPEASMPVIRMGFGDLQGFELMQRAAKALAASTLVPTQFQNNLPNCLISLEMAQRIGASPLMVMQNLYIVHGRPGWSAKFLIASFNQCGRFAAVRYEWVGERGKDTWGCRAYATEKQTGERIEGPTITIALAKAEGWEGKSGSKWKTIPELMLMYRAAAWMINTHAPEISMGLNTAEELGDVYDARPDANGQFQVTTESLQRVDELAAGAGASSGSGNVIDGASGNAAPTIVDALYEIAKGTTPETIGQYVDSLPEEMRSDSRITKAVKDRLDELKKGAKPSVEQLLASARADIATGDFEMAEDVLRSLPEAEQQTIRDEIAAAKAAKKPKK